jgi:LysM repeat protein
MKKDNLYKYYTELPQWAKGVVVVGGVGIIGLLGYKLYKKLFPSDSERTAQELLNTITSDIQRWNNLKSTRLSVGQRLYVSAPVARVNSNTSQDTTTTLTESRSSSSASSQENILRYVVKKNDSLHTIAQIHNVTVDSIKKANKLDSNRIMPGQVLVIER